MYPPYVTSSPTGPRRLLGGGYVASRQGVFHRHPGNAALIITTKHLHLRLMSGTPAAHEGCFLKWGEKTHWGSWTEAPWETELMRVSYPLTETDWNPGELHFTQTPCCTNNIWPSPHDVTSSLHFDICVNKSPSGLNSATTVSVLSFTPLQYILTHLNSFLGKINNNARKLD